MLTRLKPVIKIPTRGFSFLLSFFLLRKKKERKKKKKDTKVRRMKHRKQTFVFAKTSRLGSLPPQQFQIL